MTDVAGPAVRHEPAELVRLEAAVMRLTKRMFSPSLLQARLGIGGSHLDRAGYAALTRLDMCGEVRLSDLAGELSLDPSTVSRQVRLLERLELVRRRPHPEDGRASLLALTDQGADVLRGLQEQRISVLQGALLDWSPADRELLIGLLERLAADLGGPHQPGCTRPVSTASDRKAV